MKIKTHHHDANNPFLSQWGVLLLSPSVLTPRFTPVCLLLVHSPPAISGFGKKFTSLFWGANIKVCIFLSWLSPMYPNELCAKCCSSFIKEALETEQAVIYFLPGLYFLGKDVAEFFYIQNSLKQFWKEQFAIQVNWLLLSRVYLGWRLCLLFIN